MDQKIENENIRWHILMILHAKRLAGQTRSGGWVELPILRRLLDKEGYSLTEAELKDFCVYLDDDEINCLETQKIGHAAPYRYSYRITAKGVRAVNYEEKVPGVGIYDR